MKMQITIGLVGGIAVSTLAACPISSSFPDHCANQDGDGYCARKYPDGDKAVCTLGECSSGNPDGCVAARPTDDACYSPCGADKSIEDDPGCVGVAEGSSTSETLSSSDVSGAPTTEPTGPMTMSGSETESSGVTATETSTTTGGACVMSSECVDAGNPICVEMACVSCTTDEQCGDRDPNFPACREDGQCVACTASNASGCTDTTPVCDEPNSACVGCDFHEQCPDSACRIATGGCFDEAEVYDVGAGQTYANLTDAVADLGEGGEVVLRVHDGPSYDEAVTITGMGTAYAILADDDNLVPQWVNTGGGAPTLNIEDGAEVYVQSLRFTLNGDGAFPGIVADAASLYLDRTSVVNNDGGGIVLTNAASGHLRNCFVGGNVNDVAALEVTATATVDVLYSTVLGAYQFGGGAALRCVESGAVTVRNSLLALVGAPAEIQCDDATLTTSATETGIGGTVVLGNVMPGWFVSLSDDFSLNNPPAALLTAAEWTLVDPLVDIDGDPRPNVDGAADVAGADLAP